MPEHGKATVAVRLALTPARRDVVKLTGGFDDLDGGINALRRVCYAGNAVRQRQVAANHVRPDIDVMRLELRSAAWVAPKPSEDCEQAAS